MSRSEIITELNEAHGIDPHGFLAKNILFSLGEYFCRRREFPLFWKQNWFFLSMRPLRVNEDIHEPIFRFSYPYESPFLEVRLKDMLREQKGSFVCIINIHTPPVLSVATIRIFMVHRTKCLGN